MKIIKITLIFLALAAARSDVFSQKKLVYGMYYSIDADHTPRHYNHYLVVTNAPPAAVLSMKKYALKEKYDVVFSIDIFPPVKDYTDDEIKQKVNDLNVDAILYLQVRNVETPGSKYSLGTFYMKPTGGSYSPYSASNHSVYMDIGLVEPEIKDKFILTSSGKVGGKLVPAIGKTFINLLRRLPEIGVVVK